MKRPWAPTLRRSFVPASGRDAAPVPAGSPAIDYRVKLRVVWDSPTVSELKDAIPTLAEAEFAWTPQQMPLPAGRLRSSRAQPRGPDRLRQLGARRAHRLHEGIARHPERGRSRRAHLDLHEAAHRGAGIRAGASVGRRRRHGSRRRRRAGGRAALRRWRSRRSTLGGGPLVGDGSKAALTSATFETEMRSISDPGPDMQVRVVTDYVCTLHINGGVLGVKTIADQPMKIRYKRVGHRVRQRRRRAGSASASSTPAPHGNRGPGSWEIEGVLGSLLRIVEVAMGRGSVWIERRIAAGTRPRVVEVTRGDHPADVDATAARCPTSSCAASTSRLTSPSVIQGEGRLRIEDGGVIRAGVEANISRVGLGVEAALALAKMGRPSRSRRRCSCRCSSACSSARRCRWRSRALAIYGFKGMFVMNGERKRCCPTLTRCYASSTGGARPRSTKYRPAKGPVRARRGRRRRHHARRSFCSGCGGMLVVAFPDIEVILGVDVEDHRDPETEASDEGGQSGNDHRAGRDRHEAVKVAVWRSTRSPSCSKSRFRSSANFPVSRPARTSYVRLGSDGQTAHGRFGEPVTLKLLPGKLDARSWSYLMIEQDGLPASAATSGFSFEGFSVGFGAGWWIEWKRGTDQAVGARPRCWSGSGPTRCMVKGGVFVQGELDLVVLSISARGELILEAGLQAERGSQESLPRSKASSAARSTASSSRSRAASASHRRRERPEPSRAPAAGGQGLSLTDRRDRVMGEAAPVSVPIEARPLFESVPSTTRTCPRSTRARPLKTTTPSGPTPRR